MRLLKFLQAKGYTKKEAEGFIEAIQEINLFGVATKQDVFDLKGEMGDLRKDIAKSHSDILKFQIIQTVAIIRGVFLIR